MENEPAVEKYEDRMELIIGNPEKPTLRLVMKPKELAPILNTMSDIIFHQTPPPLGHISYARPIKEAVEIRRIRSKYQCFRDNARTAYDEEMRDLNIDEEIEIEELSAKK